MNRHIVVILSMGLLRTLLNGQILVENYDYGPLENNDITVVASDWTRHNGIQGPAYKTTGLTYPDYVSSGVGGSLWFTRGSSGINDGDVHRCFPSITTTTNIFVSFLVRIDSARTTADYFFHLGPNIIGNTFRGRVYAKKSGAGWCLGISKSSETRSEDTTVLHLGQTYLAVLKYTFSIDSTDDDQAVMYLYDHGIPITEPGNPLVTIGPSGNGTDGDPINLGSIAVRQGSNSPAGFIDGIRIDTCWTNLISTDVKVHQGVLPSKKMLKQNYPNPFNPNTTLCFSFDTPHRAILKVYNILGQHVATLFDGFPQTGIIYTVQFYADNLPAGFYIAQLDQDNVRMVRKMMLTK
jgi:hypothetical protein